MRRIGFQYARQIDPFDGGPHFIATTDNINLVKLSRPMRVTAVDSADASRPWAIVAVERDGELRATGARVIPNAEHDTLGLTGDARELLGLSEGESVWAVIP